MYQPDGSDPIRAAWQALRAAVDDIEASGMESGDALKDRLLGIAHRILSAVDDHEESESGAWLGHLDRDSRAIADDLRRAERLIRERTGKLD